MKNIFLTGATGVLGKRVVQLLLEAGFGITGLSRSQENTRLLEKMGAKSKQTSLFNVDELITATRNFDVIVHLATAIPTAAIPKKPHHWALNDKIRIDGTMALLDAARAVVYALQRFKTLKNRTVNFTDFEPIRANTALIEAARLTNSKSPYQMPVFLSRMILLKRFTKSYYSLIQSSSGRYHTRLEACV